MSNIFAETSIPKMAANILESFTRADADCRHQGIDWYPSTNRLVMDFASAADLDPSVVAAIVAVLSPRSAWGTNVRNTAAVLVESGHLTHAAASAILKRHGYSARDSQGNDALSAPRGLARSITKARAIAESESTVHVTGQKVLSFYWNILDPVHSDEVTIDAWAAGVAIGRRLNNADMSGLNARQYRRVADAYRMAATMLRLRPHVLQAITWCELRGRNR